jgi:hypothetical protein
MDQTSNQPLRDEDIVTIAGGAGEGEPAGVDQDTTDPKDTVDTDTKDADADTTDPKDSVDADGTDAGDTDGEDSSGSSDMDGTDSGT